MTLLSILNLDFKDVITLVITPAVLAFVGGTKILQDRKDKRNKEIEAELDKHKFTLQCDLDKEKTKADAEVEKEKLRVAGEVDKAKEKSLGAEAIVKIWKNMDTIQLDMDLFDKQLAEEHTNYVLVKEILGNIKSDYDKLTKSLWDKFLNSN